MADLTHIRHTIVPFADAIRLPPHQRLLIAAAKIALYRDPFVGDYDDYHLWATTYGVPEEDLRQMVEMARRGAEDRK